MKIGDHFSKGFKKHLNEIVWKETPKPASKKPSGKKKDIKVSRSEIKSLMNDKRTYHKRGGAWRQDNRK